MSYSKVLTGTTHTVHQDREVRWGLHTTSLLLDLINLLNGTPQDVSATTSTTSINVSLGHNIALALGATTAVTLTGGRNGDRYMILVTQGGSFSLTWTTSIKWKGGVAPTITSGAGALDIITIFKSATHGYVGTYSQAFA